jgi:hypothetical protein
MPPKIPTKRMTTSVKGGLSDILKDFKIEDLDVTIDDNELSSMIDELTVTTPFKSPQEVDSIVVDRMEVAVKGMQFAILDESKKHVLSRVDVDQDKITQKVDKNDTEAAMKSLPVFAFLHGNVTSKKYWWKVGSKGKDSNLFVSLPALDVTGSHSTLVHFYREHISGFLVKGYKNTLVTVLEKGGIDIHPDKLEYLFPKGHLLVGEIGHKGQKSDISVIRKELDIIFKQMMIKDVNDRNFSSIKWFKESF